jgi:hypothetical protein
MSSVNPAVNQMKYQVEIPELAQAVYKRCHSESEAAIFGYSRHEMTIIFPLP